MTADLKAKAEAKSNEVQAKLLLFQENEITEHHIYRALAGFTRDAANREVLLKISGEELRHYQVWKKHSGKDVSPAFFKHWFYVVVSWLFGLTFGIKLMERGEKGAQLAYGGIKELVPEAGELLEQETEHERLLIGMINEERLVYIGSVVLGLNDALVEFTGALAGFTFALGKPRLVGVAGLIMGVSASLSMAASEYLSTKSESESRDPLKASLYTGAAYVITVVALVAPFLLFASAYLALAVTLLCAVFLILVFTFYFSVVKEIGFKRHFFEMLFISLGVAFLSFVIGFLARRFLQVDF